MKPFSILMSVYENDNPDFLNDSIASVVCQLGDSTTEFVLVKDGPIKEDLNRIIEKYAEEYPGLFKIISLNSNCGLGSALNEGLKHCTYDLIARMDADDICALNRFKKQLDFLEKNPEISIVGGFIEEFIHKPGDLGRIKKVPIDCEEIIAYAQKRCPFNHPSVMFRKDVIFRVGSYIDMPSFEDYYLWVRLIKAGFKGFNIPEVLLHFRIGNDMIGRRHGIKYMLKEYNFILSMKKIGFIKQMQFLKLVIIRLPFRLLPKFLLQKVYQILR